MPLHCVDAQDGEVDLRWEGMDFACIVSASEIGVVQPNIRRCCYNETHNFSRRSTKTKTYIAMKFHNISTLAQKWLKRLCGQICESVSWISFHFTKI